MKCDFCNFEVELETVDTFFRDEECFDGSYLETEMWQCPKCKCVDNVIRDCE